MVNPTVAAIISFFLPGIGQAIQGETKKGIIMFVLYLIIGSILIYGIGMIGQIICIIFAIWAAYDAYKLG